MPDFRHGQVSHWPCLYSTCLHTMRDSPLFDLIVVQDDGSTQRRVLSARTYTLGRSSQSDIQLDHKHISRQHARLICSAGAVTIEDLESANGIFVNGQRLPVRSPCAVSGSDSISLGKFVKLQLEAHVPSRADSAPSTHTGAVDFTGPTASGGLEIPADSLASGLRFGTRLKSL